MTMQDIILENIKKIAVKHNHEIAEQKKYSNLGDLIFLKNGKIKFILHFNFQNDYCQLIFNDKKISTLDRNQLFWGYYLDYVKHEEEINRLYETIEQNL